MDPKNLQNKSREELLQIAQAAQALDEKKKYHKLQYIFPVAGPRRRELYKPHIEFMSKGRDHRFRVFMGGNRSGKSFTMGTEIAYHVTGEYPDWWQGRVFKYPRAVWIVAESGALFRDSLQKVLFGESGEDVGTGLLPLAEKNNDVGIVSYAAMAGTSGGIGSCIVKHKKGHTVQIVVKTNEMSREQFQAAKVDVVAFDEEPREDIYVECLMRLMGTDKEQGIAMLAFTPLKGLSSVVLKFLPNGQFPARGSPLESPENYVCRVEWQDVPHLSKEDMDALLNEIPDNERDARAKGIPSLGSGRVFTTEEDFILCKPFEIPDYWPKCFGLDYGWHATAAVWIAEEPRSKTKYIYAEYKRGRIIDDLHIESIKARGAGIPGIDDPHCGIRDDGKTKRDYFRGKGLELYEGLSGNAGFDIMRALFETGKLKIFNNCQELLKEYRVFRFDSKDPNKIAAKQDDHLLDAAKYALTKFDWYARPDEAYLQDKDNPANIMLRTRDDLTGY